ncbi:methylmalonyl-CoA epimerase [Athalassotoga saccharophila]|uniref:methylmalonyl-CoA epimerase n=1 Tax=Athalassotoga saccharophila TaxID=1441386 RepID=UPI00137A2E00|nr:methylmalonyl-CoA epimerase [Athalassotoga saccharophila]BBJ28217.1 methylmalonyl-CoA epimerase [Athalassotoga saccharophila]
MKVKKIDHIGVAVKSISQASKLYTGPLSLEGKEEILEDRKLKVMMIRVGDTRIELLEDQDPAGTISKFIEKRGEGLNHIAFEVDDIYETAKNLKAQGYRITSEPSAGADNTIVTFVHPKDANGVMIELVERRKD